MSKKILLVDDDPGMHLIVVPILTKAGYFVLSAKNGEQALQMALDERPDLIILDVEMPKMNGYDFLKERGKIPGGNRAPVIMLTAYDSVEPIFRRNRVAEYLVKPIRFQDLFAKVCSVLDACDAQGQPENCSTEYR